MKHATCDTVPSTARIPGTSTLRKTTPKNPSPFEFPTGSHLLITTARHVFAWDYSGIRPIFRSRRGSIAAAREAKDGSGILAIASSNVVVLHDTKHGKQESWGLNGQHEELRHLEYAPDAQSLYLTTTSDGAVQHYSTRRSRLLDPAQRHGSAPVALAISPTGHLLLSASQCPPVVYVKNLAHNSSSIHIQPNASSSPVCCAAFHPERPNVFLLAFRDGVIAAYDATKMPRPNKAASRMDQRGPSDGEIAHMTTVHRAVISGDELSGKPGIAAPIAGAAFLPGFKTRAITAGRDGRCELVDFAKGGVVLRTWHAQAPLTSIAVTPVGGLGGRQPMGGNSSKHQRARSSGSHTIGGPTSTDSIIAVARVDGKVCLYDSVGLMLDQALVSSQEEPIIGLEWARGSAPGPVLTETSARRFSSEYLAEVSLNPPLGSPPLRTIDGKNTSSRSGANSSGTLGLPSALKISDPTSSQNFAPYPHEIYEDTMRYKPSSKRAQIGPATCAEYHDLFSPVKPRPASPRSPEQQRLRTPPGSRPRICSQTFVNKPKAQDTRSPDLASLHNPVISPTTANDTIGMEHFKPRSQVGSPTQIGQMSTKVSSQKTTQRRIAFAGDGSTSSRRSTPVVTNINAKILADLRRLDRNGTYGKHGTLSSYAASQRSRVDKSTRRQSLIKQPPRAEVHVADPSTWPTDSASLSGEVINEDIWLTSESEDETSRRSRRRMKPLIGPSARQTSRSKVDSRETISTTAILDAARADSQHAVDGSTDENMLKAATRLTPPVAFLSPASEHVREIFPRVSSLSSDKKARPVRMTVRRSPTRKALVAIAPNVCRQPKSPWARVKAGKNVLACEGDTPPMVSGALPRSEGIPCLSCPDTKARVKGLEVELAQLKGEVLALKAILRRNGLPFPACLR